MENQISRRMQKLVLFVLVVLFAVGALSQHARAQTQPQGPSITPTPTPTPSPTPGIPLPTPPPDKAKTEPRMGVNGQIRLVSRISEKDDEYQHNIQGAARLDGFLKISECVQLRTRVSTGDAYHSENILPGIGPAPAQIDINVRHLYIDSDCLGEAVRVEAGSIPVRNHGYLGLSSSGWIDGIRVTVQSSENTNINFSIGSVETGDANVFTRQRGDINHIQLDVEQKLFAKLKGYTSIAKYNDMLFTRGGLKYALSELVSWIEEVGVEGIGEGGNLLGGYLFSDFDLGDYNFRVAASSIEPKVSEPEKLALLIKDFYGFGDNLYLIGDRDVAKNLNLGARLRIGDAGQQFELRLTHKFKAQR